MYIPQVTRIRPRPSSPKAHDGVPGLGHAPAPEVAGFRDVDGPEIMMHFRSWMRRLATSSGDAAATRTLGHGATLRKRDAVSQMNTTIGVVVGVLLAVFLLAVAWFLYVYRKSIRFTPRKKRRHRKSSGSKSSQSSQSTAEGAGAEEAPPA
ncbi:hypothetical protein F5Y15DRAFT_421729 [Xylariaceae sp. FL0016]|nr:hypothetical protein F5Y15DRAFT_421729 [Xylariaceae sp. FL0016]